MNVTLPEGYQVIGIILDDGTKHEVKRYCPCSFYEDKAKRFDILKSWGRVFIYLSEEILWETNQEFTAHLIKKALENPVSIVKYTLNGNKLSIWNKEIALSLI